MSDQEKLKVIEKMITDFWEYCDEQKQRAGAEVLITAILTVVSME